MGKLTGFLLVVCMACSTPEDRVLQEAIQTHDLVEDLGRHISNKMDLLMRIAGDPQNDSTSLLIVKDSIRLIRMDFEDWKSALVGIPGEENNNAHTHHEHEVSGITSEMILDIQKELLKRAVSLNIRCQRMIEQLRKAGLMEERREKTARV